MIWKPQNYEAWSGLISAASVQTSRFCMFLRFRFIVLLGSTNSTNKLFAGQKLTWLCWINIAWIHQFFGENQPENGRDPWLNMKLGAPASNGTALGHPNSISRDVNHWWSKDFVGLLMMFGKSMISQWPSFSEESLFVLLIFAGACLVFYCHELRFPFGNDDGLAFRQPEKNAQSWLRRSTSETRLGSSTTACQGWAG